MVAAFPRRSVPTGPSGTLVLERRNGLRRVDGIPFAFCEATPITAARHTKQCHVGDSMVMKQRSESGRRREVRLQEQQRRRAVLEEFLTAYRLACHTNTMFASRPEASMTRWHITPPAPACIAALGLTWPCTRQDVKQAFRTKVKVAHPDSGGNSEAFQRLYRAYQEALALVVN
jgi:hypothetical protein